MARDDSLYALNMLTKYFGNFEKISKRFESDCDVILVDSIVFDLFYSSSFTDILTNFAYITVMKPTALDVFWIISIKESCKKKTWAWCFFLCFNLYQIKICTTIHKSAKIITKRNHDFEMNSKST